jgi:hypothetical protein
MTGQQHGNTNVGRKIMDRRVSDVAVGGYDNSRLQGLMMRRMMMW